MSMFHSGSEGLLRALALSLALHAAVLLMHGHARAGGGAISARSGTQVRLVSRAPVPKPHDWVLAEHDAMQAIPAEPSLPEPIPEDRPAQEPTSPLDVGEGGEFGEAGAEGPRFLEEPTLSDVFAERLRGIGDVDLALTVSRDGKVSRIEVLRPALTQQDYGWLATMIANARIAPGTRDGVPIDCRWVIRISAPPRVEAATG